MNNMSDKVQNWRSSWQPMLNSSPKSPMVEKVHFGIEEQNQGPPWEEERTPHMLQLPSGDDEIYSWIDNSYNIQDISLPEPYNPHSCTSSLAPPLMYPATTTMIGQHVGPSNSAGGFSVASTLTTIPNLDPNNGEPEDDRRKATELLGDYQIETQMENNNPTIKRQRSAEIHNLSERRRRDRINVQMKDLQELIPLSNKLDKASILQGTCEYVKSLKIQLEMFSLMCEIHQTTSIGYPGRFHMPGYYACPTNPFNIPGMLEFNLHSQAHKTAFAGVCKQYLSLYEIEFARGAKPKMHSYTNPRHQAQMASAAQICQHYLSVYQADQSKQIQDQAFPPIFQNKFTRGF